MLLFGCCHLGNLNCKMHIALSATATMVKTPFVVEILLIPTVLRRLLTMAHIPGAKEPTHVHVGVEAQPDCQEDGPAELCGALPLLGLCKHGGPGTAIRGF